MTTTPGRPVLISGAGIAGPALAFWLRQAGYTPTIVERAPEFRTGGYMIDFWGVGYEVAIRMGLRAGLARDGYDIKEVRIVDSSGRRITGFEARIFAAASPEGFTSLPRGDLAHLIYEKIRDDVEFIFSDSIAALTQDDAGVDVRLEHGGARRFEFVIGADGLHSNVRALAFGPASEFEHYLGYYTAAFSVAGYPHRDEDVYLSYGVPGRQISRYGLRDGRTAFFLIFTSDAPLAVGHHDVAAQKQVLRDRFAGIGWETADVLSAMDRADDLYFDTVSQARVPQWSRGRIALVGDAAYCPSLLAGQGSALGMAGGYILAQALSQSPDDHARAFASYQELLKPFVDRKQEAATRFASWFAPRTKWQLHLRNLGTRLMNVPGLGLRLARNTISDDIRLPEPPPGIPVGATSAP